MNYANNYKLTILRGVLLTAGLSLSVFLGARAASVSADGTHSGDTNSASSSQAIVEYAVPVENHAMGNTFQFSGFRAANSVDTLRIGDTTRPRFDMVDLASYQSWLTQANFNELQQNGVRAAIVKITESTNYKNPAARQQIQRANTAGLRVGVYHYARFSSVSSARAEANFSLKTIRELNLPKTTPIVADIEENADVVGDVKGNLTAFWQVFSAAGYNVHRVYTGGGYTKAASAIATVGNKLTWWAQYPYTPSKDSLWNTQYGAWQFSSTAQLPSQFGRYGAQNIDVSIDYSGIFTGQSNSQNTDKNDNRYVTISRSDVRIFENLNGVVMPGVNLVNKTLLSKHLYNRVNGITYLSLYDNTGKWRGYVNQADVQVAPGPQGSWFSDNRFATLMQAKKPIFDNFSGKVRSYSDKYIGQTYRIDGRYQHFNGSTFYSLYDHKQNWLGYMRAQDVNTVSYMQGVNQGAGGYLKIVKKGGSVWKDFNWKQSINTTSLYNQIFKIGATYNAYNGYKYFSIYRTNGEWIGYANALDVKLVKNETTSSKDNRFVTISSKNPTLFENLHGKVMSKSTAYYQRTYRSKAIYNLSTGEVYLSLYDKNDKWVGYIDQRDVQVAPGSQGIWFEASGYVTLINSRNRVYENLSGKVNKNSQIFVGKTYRVAGKYHLFNDAWFYTIYDVNGHWIGYVNAQETTKIDRAQGINLDIAKYVEVVEPNGKIWKDFNWKQSISTSTLAGQVFKARAEYNHFNGYKYYSIYKPSGEWVGYANARDIRESAPQGPYIQDNRYVTVQAKSLILYDNLNEKIKSKNGAHYLNTYLSKAQYHHINGKTYLSLYDNKDNWLGYVNSQDVQIASGPQGSWMSTNKYATLLRTDRPIYENFSGKLKGNTNSVYGKTYKVSGGYHHFDTQWYYTLYDNQDRWLGYVRANDVSETADPQGVKQAFSGHVKISRKNGQIWKDFGWKEKISTTELYGKEYRAEGKFVHVNEYTYYSLYQLDGRWMGYANARDVELIK